MDAEFLAAKARYEEAKKLSTLACEAVEKTHETLKRLCRHARTKEEESYCAGGYLDRSSWTVRVYCRDCGEKIGKDSTTYGSFS